MQTFAQERLLTELDHVRLTKLIERAQRDAVLAHPNAEIEDLLDGAEVVPARQIAADVVTMYSQVELIDADSAARSRLTLCYPADADAPAGLVSVLSPVGAALLGLRVGALARWREPSGRARAARVLGIVFQPEASGDYTT